MLLASNESQPWSSSSSPSPVVVVVGGSSTMLTPLAAFLTTYYQLAIVVIGLVGNTLTILLFSKTHLTHLRRTRFFLINLAFTDNAYLLVILFQYVDARDLLLTISSHRVACKLTVYVTYVLNFVSNGLVLTFTVQRFCSVCFPLRMNKYDLDRRSKFVVAWLVLFAFLFYSFSLVMFDLEEEPHAPDDEPSPSPPRSLCKASTAFENTVERLNFFDSLLTLVIPFLGLLVMNAMIIRTLRNTSDKFVATSAIAAATNVVRAIQLRNSRSPKSENTDEDGVGGGGGVPGEEDTLTNLPSQTNSSTGGTGGGVGGGGGCGSSVTRMDVTSNTSVAIHKKSSLSITSLQGGLAGAGAGKARSSLMLGNKKSIDCGGGTIIINSKANSVSRKVTKMLIVLSSTFLLLNLPIHSFNIYINIRILLTKREYYYPIESDIKEICDSVFYTSFAINFLLYSVSGVSYRDELKELLVELWSKSKKNRQRRRRRSVAT